MFVILFHVLFRIINCSTVCLFIFLSECCMAQRFVVQAVALLSAKLSEKIIGDDRFHNGLFVQLLGTGETEDTSGQRTW